MDTTRLGQIIQWRTVPQTVLRLWKNGSRHHLHHRLEFRGGLPAGSWGPSWTWLYASLSKGHREANIRATNPPLPPELKRWTGALQWSASAYLTLSPVPQSSLTPTPWLMASCRGRRYQCRGRERRGEDHGHRWHREHTRRYGGGQRNWANIRGRRACWSLCSKSCKVSSTENITFIYFIRAALSLSRR